MESADEFALRLRRSNGARLVSPTMAVKYTANDGSSKDVPVFSLRRNDP